MDITIETKFESTQEIFEFVIGFLAKQGTQSINQDQCVYNDNGGKKCAVGCLIPSEIYTPEIEGWRIDQIHKSSEFLEVNNFFRNSGLASNMEFLHTLQGFHDKQSNWYSKANFINAANLIADHSGLRQISWNNIQINLPE